MGFRYPGEASHCFEQLAVVDRDNCLAQVDGVKGIGEDADRFRIGEHRGRTHDVGVALPELAKSAPLRLLGAPDRGDVISLERDHGFLLVHREVAGERNGEIVAESDFAITLIEEVVHQLLVLASLAGEDFHVFERRRVQWLETVTLEHGTENRNHLQPEPHLVRRVVPEALENLRFTNTHAIGLQTGFAAMDEGGLLFVDFMDDMPDFRTDQLLHCQLDRVAGTRCAENGGAVGDTSNCPR